MTHSRKLLDEKSSNFQGFQRVPLVMLWHCFRCFSDRGGPPELGAPENAWFGKRKFCVWQFCGTVDYYMIVRTLTPKLDSTQHFTNLFFVLLRMPLPKAHRVLCALWGSPKPKGKELLQLRFK